PRGRGTGRGRAPRAPPARSGSSAAHSAGAGGSRRRSLRAVLDGLEKLSGAWRVLHGPVGDDRRTGFVDDSLQLAASLGIARVGGGGPNVADEELDVREHDHRVDLPIRGERRLEKIARAVEPREVLVIPGHQGARRLDGGLGPRPGDGRENDGNDDQRADAHRRALYRRGRGASILTPPEASAILRFVISFGVQTWGTDVVALRRSWRAADDLGYARITYGDGLWGWTHDGWTMLGALAGLTRRARLGPAVTYCFDPSSH